MALNTKYIILAGSGATAVAGGVTGIFYFSKGKLIKDELTSSGEILLKEDTEYQIAFKEFKDDIELTKAISTEQKAISASSEVNEGSLALKNWCEKILNKNLSDSDSKEKSKKYCIKSALTIQKKINRGTRKIIEDWTAKFNSIKGSNDALLKDLKEINSQITNLSASDQATNATNALTKWCTDIQKVNLIDNKDNSIWGKVEKRCLQ